MYDEWLWWTSPISKSEGLLVSARFQLLNKLFTKVTSYKTFVSLSIKTSTRNEWFNIFQAVIYDASFLRKVHNVGRENERGITAFWGGSQYGVVLLRLREAKSSILFRNALWILRTILPSAGWFVLCWSPRWSTSRFIIVYCCAIKIVFLCSYELIWYESFLSK